MQTGGMRINSMPKDGGNTFSGTFFAYGAGQRAAGGQPVRRGQAVHHDRPGIAYDYQINPSFGGPLMKDKLWFYVTYKYQDNKTYVPSSKFADGSPAYRKSMGNYSGVGRVTWAGLEPRQDPLLPREAVQWRVLQRLQHAGDHVAGSVDRRVWPRLGAAAQMDADPVEQAAARGRHLVLHAALRAGLHVERGTARSRRTWNRRPAADRSPPAIRFRHIPAPRGLQHDGVSELRHRLARDQDGPDRSLGQQLADLTSHAEINTLSSTTARRSPWRWPTRPRARGRR